MKPPPFRYHDPRSRTEVLDLLTRLDNAKLLAGGQSLMPMLNMRFVLPDHLIDLNRVTDLAFIRDDGAAIEVGAMTRQHALETSAEIRARLPVVGEALRHVGHRQTRNRGTLGGSLSHLDPAAELVTVALALDAVVTIAGASGERRVAMADFPLGYMTPAVGFDELLVSVAFPVPPLAHGHGFVEFSRRHGDYAMAAAAALLTTDANGCIESAALALGGVGPVPLRMTEIEAALVGQRPSDALFADACRMASGTEAVGDAVVSAEYRRQLAPVVARRALAMAAARLPQAALAA